MATGTATVYIGGTKLLPYHVQIEQSANWHHQFEIMVSIEKAKVMGGQMNAPESVTIENAIALVGETAEISMERPNGSFTFKGYVTDVNIDQTYAGDAFIIFRGYSPTYLLEGQKSVTSFEGKSIKDIFNEVIKGFPSNVKKQVKPRYSGSVPYIVRYKETQYQFLSRLAASYGEWFYYDGQGIVFGELPGGGSTVSLKFGSDSMLSFNYGINVRPTSFKQQFYKSDENSLMSESVSGYKPGWLDPHSKTALKAGDKLFSEEGIDPITDYVQDGGQIKHLAQSKKSSLLSNVMLFSGRSAHPGVTVGAVVEVYSKSGFIGKYRVVSVNHSFNHNRDYFNTFKAVQATSEAPPPNPRVYVPQAETQVGEVIDNADPNSLGRVKVKFKWPGETPWLSVTTQHATKDWGEGIAGIYFTPEIGDEVIVGFEQGDPSRPYVIGSRYHGGIAPEFFDGSNNLKAIKTRSGHKLVFDDTDGNENIWITDKNENHIKIETNGDKITVKAGESIFVEAGKEIFVEAGERISMKAGRSIAIEAGSDISINAGSNISINSGAFISATSGSVSLSGSGSVSVNAGSAYTLITTNKLENVSASSILKAKNLSQFVSKTISCKAENIDQVAKKNMNTKAKKNILLSADSKLDQRGGNVDVNAKKGNVRVNAKGNTILKGKQVKAN